MRLPRRGTAARLAAATLLLLAAGGLAWAGWIEPYRRLGAERVELPILAGSAGGFRVAHLSDLHVTAGHPGEAALLDELIARVAGARPDLVAVSGDLWDDAADAETVAANVEAAADLAARLRGIAPVVAVQGHSDHLGTGVARLAAAGVRWLHNESLPIDTPGGPFLLVGLSQQAGYDELVRELRHDRPRFAALPLPGGGRGWGAAFDGQPRNVYAHYDPAPVGRPRPAEPWGPPSAAARLPGPADPRLAAAGGPLDWSGVDVTVEAWLSDAATGAGLVVHSRHPRGEDRMVRLRRVGPAGGDPGSFVLVAHGTEWTDGQPDTGFVPPPGRWVRLRLATRATAEALRVAAKAWPADEPEPPGWQAWTEDRSPLRPAAGTVGLWAWGGGTVLYRDLEVRAADGRPLHAAPLTPSPGADLPPGW
ncbi:MAG TPA: metallophosphoesterase, partial [Thermoanaerobaculia bacterium]|nr:metallophosphoesterase [Thermoanaerobaculia bacterium]